MHFERLGSNIVPPLGPFLRDVVNLNTTRADPKGDKALTSPTAKDTIAATMAAATTEELFAAR